MRGQKSAYKHPQGMHGTNEPITSGRAAVDKKGGAKEFGGNVAKSRAANFQQGSMRGGIRL